MGKHLVLAIALGVGLGARTVLVMMPRVGVGKHLRLAIAVGLGLGGSIVVVVMPFEHVRYLLPQ